MDVVLEDKNAVGSALRFTISNATGQRLPGDLREYLLGLNRQDINNLRSDTYAIAQEILKFRPILVSMLNGNESAITDELIQLWVEAALVNGAEPELRGLGDAVEKTLSAIGITKDRYAQLTGKKKGCSKCSQRQARLNRLVPFRQGNQTELNRMQFLYCYFHNAAKQDELRWSMRSIDTYYRGEASFLVIGDKPPWYEGPFIEHPRVRRASGFRRGLRDVLFKLNTVQNHPLVADEFFWMMDDVFLLRPITKQELIIPRAFGDIRESRMNGWRSVCSNTSDRLKELGLPYRDFATHLGHHIVKENLQKLFQVWDPIEEVFLWEVAYGNTFHSEPAAATPYLRRYRHRGNDSTYYRISKTAAFLNVYSNAWCQSLRNWLCKTFPEPHRGEAGESPQMNFLVTETKPVSHFLLVQSAYNDAEMSRCRLEITKKFCTPSIAAQHERVQLVVSLCKDDPLLEERKAVFLAASPGVKFVYRELDRDPWPLPRAKRIVVSRCDDDDALSSDFCELTWDAACKCSLETEILTWPSGYIRIDPGNKLHRTRKRLNKFCSVVTSTGQSPYDAAAWGVNRRYPVVVVDNSRGWMRNRNDRTQQDASDRLIGKVADPPNASRWAIQLR